MVVFFTKGRFCSHRKFPKDACQASKIEKHLLQARNKVVWNEDTRQNSPGRVLKHILNVNNSTCEIVLFSQ